MTSVSMPATSPTMGTQVAGTQEMQMQRGSTQTGRVMGNRLPLQRLKPAIHKYLKVLDIHLHRLQQHQSNMDKLTKAQQWPQLHQQQLNATGTVQQITACLQQLQRTRGQVVDNQVSDLHALLMRDQDFRDKVVGVLSTFLLFCRGKQPDCDTSGTEESTTRTPPENNSSETMPATVRMPAASSSTCAPVLPDNTCAAASRDQLRQEMEELYANVLHFVETVSITQREAGETTPTDINENVPGSSEDKKKLDKTSKLKMAVLPVVGAILGGAVAGPVGVATGIKIGTLAGGVGGGVAGLATSTIFRSQKKTSLSLNVCDLQSQNNESATLTDNNNRTSSVLQSESSPDVSDTQRSSPAVQSIPASIPQSGGTDSGQPDRPREGDPQHAGADDNGNSRSLWDQILLWGQAPQQPQ